MTRMISSRNVFATATIKARIAANVLLDLRDTQRLVYVSLKAFAKTKEGQRIVKATEFVRK